MLRLLLLVMLLLVPGLSWATVYWAGSGGSNSATCVNIDSTGTSAAPGTDPGSYGTIGRAAACATVAGDIVNIKAGTYSAAGDYITTGAVPASGTSEGVRTIIQGDPGGAVPQINRPNWLQLDEAASTHRNYLTIQDLSVSGSGGSDGGGCELSLEGHHLLVQRVTVTNSYNMNICSFTATLSANNHDHVVQNNSLQHAGSGDGNGYGIYSNASEVTFQNNEVFGGKGGCVQIFADDFAVPNAIIRNNYCHDIAKATQASVLNFCFGIAVNGPNALVYNNILDGAGCGGGASGSGITAGYESSNVLLAYHNIIINWASYGIEYGLFAQTLNNEAKNNHILGNAGGTIVNSSANSSTITSTTNRTTGSGTDCWNGASDYTPKVGSACIDAGTTVAAVTSDYIGTSRPQNSVYDIGPYEYVPAGPATSGGRGSKGLMGGL